MAKKTKSQQSIEDQITHFASLSSLLRSIQGIQAKSKFLETYPLVKQFLEGSPVLQRLIAGSSVKEQYCVLVLVAMGQGPVVFRDLDLINDPQEPFRSLVKVLVELEEFYDTVGGILGYHDTILKLIVEKVSDASSADPLLNYSEPPGIDIVQNGVEVKRAARWGIEEMRHLAEIYPLGGAGDRLDLHDEATGTALPAAQLLFCGRTLLEGLIRDLQGREYLYYKLFGRQLTTPIAIMTSHEKDNHSRVMRICDSNKWFGRPKDHFRVFIQPLVPMVTIDGYWAMEAPLKPILKPGGHGVIWKLAKEQGVLDWLINRHCKKAVVRQINNPMAGVDSGLLVLSGIGCHRDKAFGFASCNRLLNSAEGMNVLCEKRTSAGYDYCITNIEYTEFERRGVTDSPVEPSSPYSRFPANTNILFVDLITIRSIIDHFPIPGMLINMKSMVTCYDGVERKIEKKAARLESTMQNIADFIVDSFAKPMVDDDFNNLRTFLTYNERRKTISVVKQSYQSDKSIVGTPEGCFYEMMINYHDLLSNYCQMELPPLYSEEVYLSKGPSFTALFHPALGGLYSIIAQKIRGGKIAEGSEWIMEIAEAEVVNLDLAGSLIIEAENILGRKDSFEFLTYDESHCGKCTLVNVKVRNQGMQPHDGRQAWKRSVRHNEALRITLKGNAEFFAEDVLLEGNIHFEVPNDHRLVVYMQEGEIAWHLEMLKKPSWKWNYLFDDEENIILEKEQ